MSSKITALLAIPLILLAWYAGYRTNQRTGGAGSEDGMLPVGSRPGKPVATFDGVSISDADLKAQIEEQAPFVRSRYASPEGRREFLENLVRFEILAREAQKKGFGKENEVIRQHKRSLVALFVQKEFEEPQQKQVIPEEDLRKYYDAHLADYQRPERVRVSHVFFEAAQNDAAKRKEKKAAAEAALAAVREKDAKDYGAFPELARRLSEDPASKPLGGDLQFLSKDDLAKRAGSEVAAVAFDTKEVGHVLDKVIETPTGFHLVKLNGRENALDLKFEGVRDSIRSRLIYEKRGDAYKKFLEGLNQKNGLSIDTAALEAVKIEAAAQPTPPTGSMPPAPLPGRPVVTPTPTPPPAPAPKK
jgi:peptidyl-prolyl cis-trans isomerase C